MHNKIPDHLFNQILFYSIIQNRLYMKYIHIATCLFHVRMLWYVKCCVDSYKHIMLNVPCNIYSHHL